MEFIAPLKQSRSEFIVKRSKFIGHVFPAFSEAEAIEYINEIKQEHSNATHNVFAYSINAESFAEKVSDDSEPRGTAGYPILDVIKKRNLQNILCVVTRYFGGIKLGAGGLVRAYSNAASLALDNTRLVTYKYHDLLTVEVNYDQFNKLKQEIELQKATIKNTSFAEKVTVDFFALPQSKTTLTSIINDLTSGRSAVRKAQGKYLPVQHKPN